MSQHRIIADTMSRCDTAEPLCGLLDLLMDANIDEHDEVYSEDEVSYARVQQAKDELRAITTAWRTERTTAQ